MTNSSSAYGTVQGTIFDNEDRTLYVTDANGVTVANTGGLPWAGRNHAFGTLPVNRAFGGSRPESGFGCGD